jgi:hypothetical protein
VTIGSSTTLETEPISIAKLLEELAGAHGAEGVIPNTWVRCQARLGFVSLLYMAQFLRI